MHPTPLGTTNTAHTLAQHVNRSFVLGYPPQPPPDLVFPVVRHDTRLFLQSVLTCSRHPTVVNVHPSVLASILTHHSRRPDAPTPRVIGTLMGTRSESGTSITVRSSFAVPHSEDDEKIALDMPFHQAMVELLSKNGAKESIVGWYATSPVINSYSALIQNYFTNETSPFPAVHLTVDTDLTRDGQGLGVKGWVSSQLGTTPKPEHCVFLPVPVQVKFDESERAARACYAATRSETTHHRDLR